MSSPILSWYANVEDCTTCSSATRLLLLDATFSACFWFLAMMALIFVFVGAMGMVNLKARKCGVLGKLMGKWTSNYDETSPFMLDNVGSITTPIVAQSAFDQAFDTLVGKRTVRTVHAPSIDQLFDRRRIK